MNKLKTIALLLSLNFILACDNQNWEEPSSKKEYNPTEISTIFENNYKDIFSEVVESVVQINLYNTDSKGFLQIKLVQVQVFLG